MRDEAPNDSDPVNSTFDRLMKNVEFLSAYVFKLNPDVGNCYIDTALHNMYHFVILLTEMLPQLSMEENLRFSEWLKSFVTATKDYRDVCGFLHHACKTNSAYSVDLVKLFLEAGADPNARNSYGEPPISVAKSSLHSIRDLHHLNGLNCCMVNVVAPFLNRSLTVFPCSVSLVYVFKPFARIASRMTTRMFRLFLCPFLKTRVHIQRL